MSDTQSVEIDPSTDDLDTFSDEFFGKTTPAVETPEDEPVEADDVAETAEELDSESEPVDDPDEAVDDPEDEEQDEPAPKKNRKSARERIEELVAKNYEAQARANEYERKLQEIERRLTEIKEPKAEPVKVSDGPDPDAKAENGEFLYPLGEFDPAFIAALTRHTLEQQTAELKTTMAREAEDRKIEEAREAKAGAWNDRLVEVAKDYDDFRPTIAGLQAEFQNVDPDYGVYLADTIMAMENGPEVLYYLGNNLDEAQKIVAAGPVGATLSLGRLDAMIGNAVKTEGKKKAARVTEAPEPAPVTSRGRGASVSVRPDTDDLDAFSKAFFKK